MHIHHPLPRDPEGVDGIPCLQFALSSPTDPDNCIRMVTFAGYVVALWAFDHIDCLVNTPQNPSFPLCGVLSTQSSLFCTFSLQPLSNYSMLASYRADESNHVVLERDVASPVARNELSSTSVSQLKVFFRTHIGTSNTNNFEYRLMGTLAIASTELTWVLIVCDGCETE